MSNLTSTNACRIHKTRSGPHLTVFWPFYFLIILILKNVTNNQWGRVTEYQDSHCPKGCPRPLTLNTAKIPIATIRVTSHSGKWQVTRNRHLERANNLHLGHTLMDILAHHVHHRDHTAACWNEWSRCCRIILSASRSCGAMGRRLTCKCKPGIPKRLPVFSTRPPSLTAPAYFPSSAKYLPNQVITRFPSNPSIPVNSWSAPINATCR